MNSSVYYSNVPFSPPLENPMLGNIKFTYENSRPLTWQNGLISQLASVEI
jgi:hypothetical protein